MSGRAEVAFPCPCGSGFGRVVDTRVTGASNPHGAQSLRRRRACLVCGRRATTYEQMDQESVSLCDPGGLVDELEHAVDRLGGP